ncbi:MAG: glycosyltransferase [Pseudomonadota bacterium]
MKPLRVLMLVTNLGLGGAQRVFFDHATAFSDFAEVEEAVFKFEAPERIFDTGLPLRALELPRLSKAFGPVGRLIGRAFALRKLVREQGYDVVISHMDGANWVNVLSGSRARKILVVHGTVLQDDNVRGWVQWLRLRFIFPVLYNIGDRTVAVSEGIARELQSAGRVRNVEAIPNFFNLTHIQAQARSPLDTGWDEVLARGNVLITSGRLAKEKQQAHIIDIAARLLHCRSDMRLVILGDGPMRETLLSRCRAADLRVYSSWDLSCQLHQDYDVYFAGYVTNPYQFLARSSLFIFPSAWEGFPLALCEALACGVATVSADCPTGPREILAPGTRRDSYDLRVPETAQNGVLMPLICKPADIDLWSKTVSRLLTDSQERSRLVANGRRSIQKLDRPQIVARWKRLIAKVVR